jgi:integrase/recombinase XerD
MTWLQYLESRYRASTVKRYLWEIARFKKYHPQAERATRAEVLAYLDTFRKAGKSADYLKAILAILKVWYGYLLESGQRKDHPCAYLSLRDPSPPLQLQDLFSEEELELLMQRKERFPTLRTRNQLITGLLIYQGLSAGELCKLQAQDIDLQEATISVPATHRTNSRILSLRSSQILAIYRYIQEDRARLVKENTNALLLTSRGTAERGSGILHLVRSQAELFPHRKLNPQTIRMSVIANWLKGGMDLRKAQYMAGHKKPSSNRAIPPNSTSKGSKARIEKLPSTQLVQSKPTIGG